MRRGGGAPSVISAGRLLILLGIAVFAYVVTAVSYWRAESRAPEGMMFIGQLANHEDINAAFSFIRQAAKGHFAFVNTMTDRDETPVYVNPQFWALGKLLTLLGWRTHLLFDVWRFLGALVLAIGCALLDRAVLHESKHRSMSRVLCLFGGGIGAYAACLHPFGQLFLNPLLAVPHGLWLAVLACIVIGEQRGRAVWYILAACLAVLRGLCGPHDLLSLFVILTVFIATEPLFMRRIDWSLTALRVLPLAASAAVSLYYIHLHSVAPTAAAWIASWYRPTPAPHWLFLAYGVAGVLLAVRLVLLRRFPLVTPTLRFLLTAALVPLCLALLSPLRATPLPVGAPSVVPAIVLSVAMIEFPGVIRSRLIRPLRYTVALFLIAGVIPSALLSTHVSAIDATQHSNYMSKAEFLAFATLNQDAEPNDVIAAPLPMSNLLGQFVSARTVVGHPVLSPDADKIIVPLNAFLRGEMDADNAAKFIGEHRIRFIFTEVGDGSAGPEYFETIPGVHVSHDEGGVTLYSVETENEPDQAQVDTGLRRAQGLE